MTGVGLSLAVAVIVWLQIGVLGVWPFFSSGLNVVVLAILLIALFRSWTMAGWLAALAGLLLGQYAIWPLAYPLALLGMLLGTWLILQRWLATRSSASLLAAGAVATTLFHLCLASLGFVSRSIQSTAIGPDWGATVQSMVVQSVIHPALLYIFWRRIRGGSYARTTMKQSF